MSRILTISRSSAVLIAVSVLLAGLLIGLGAFAGGVVVGGSRGSGTTGGEETLEGDGPDGGPGVGPAELDAALADCGATPTSRTGGTVVLGPDADRDAGRCVLERLGAPGPLLAEYGQDAPPGEAVGRGWENVQVVWEDDADGDRTTTVSLT